MKKYSYLIIGIIAVLSMAACAKAKPSGQEEDPWYYEEEVSYPFATPEYTFSEGSLRHLNY